MLRLTTPVDIAPSGIKISYSDKILILGSCFADNIGKKMKAAGFDVCINPFGTLYNPQSIANAIERLRSGRPFTADECVEMGSGAGLICSFSHHTSFARRNADEFLANANASLAEASAFYRQSTRIIVTFGTAWTFRYIGDDTASSASGGIVSNCLKRNAKEFVRERMDVDTISELFSAITARRCEEGFEDKRFIFTVSPIRHFKDGANGNQISKSTLLLAVDKIISSAEAGRCTYFPSYEIMLDELRDYRFYAEDMIHPSDQAVNYIWERFCCFALPEDELGKVAAKEKEYRQSQHRQIHI